MGGIGGIQVCTNTNRCFCDFGFTGPDCSIALPVTTPAPTEAGPTQDNEIKTEKKETRYGEFTPSNRNTRCENNFNNQEKSNRFHLRQGRRKLKISLEENRNTKKKRNDNGNQIKLADFVRITHFICSYFVLVNTILTAELSSPPPLNSAPLERPTKTRKTRDEHRQRKIDDNFRNVQCVNKLLARHTDGHLSTSFRAFAPFYHFFCALSLRVRTGSSARLLFMHFIHLEHFTGNDDEDKISTLSLVIILVVSCKFVFISFALIAVCYRLVELQYTSELKRTSKSLNFSLSMISLSLWLDCTRCVCSVNKFVAKKRNAIKGIVQGKKRTGTKTNECCAEKANQSLHAKYNQQ